jgi:alpha/beta superfamily hydrolase
MISTSTPAAPGRETGNATLRTLTLAGPAGRLEALLNNGAADAPYVAVICHPHPQGGGTMHNKVVYHAMKALNAPEFGLCWPVLRFNFRGTGLSEGTHDGKAETGDVLAALDWVENEFKQPVVLVAAAGPDGGRIQTFVLWRLSAFRLVLKVENIATPSYLNVPSPNCF